MADDPSSAAVPLPGDAVISYRADGTVRHIEAADLPARFADDATYTSLLLRRAYSELALYVLEQYGTILKLREPSAELELHSDKTDSLGYRQVRFRQTFNDRPVIAAEVVVHFNKADVPYLIQGDYLATPDQFNTTAALSAEAARESATEAFPGAVVGDPRGPAIWVDDNGQPSLVYVVLVEESIVEKSSVLVDAATGVILKKLPATYSQSL